MRVNDCRYVAKKTEVVVSGACCKKGRKEAGKRKYWNGSPGKGRGGRVDLSQDGMMKSNPTVVSLGVEMLGSTICEKSWGSLCSTVGLTP